MYSMDSASLLNLYFDLSQNLPVISCRFHNFTGAKYS